MPQPFGQLLIAQELRAAVEGDGLAYTLLSETLNYDKKIT
jgi:hypothetical protein